MLLTIFIILHYISAFMISETFEEADFPSMQPIHFHNYFREQIAFFYFHLTRKETKDVLELSKKLTDVLQILKKHLLVAVGIDDWLPYLELFYRMLGQTRDILSGKGEHELSFMMVLCFYEVFPTLAIYAVHRFVQQLDEFIPYGSWRDIKYLCEYIRQNSVKKENHELIHICVRLMNSQLKKDLESWTFSVYAGSRKHISNVAKWIPREKKHFSWLFDMLVIDWMKTTTPYYFNNVSNSWIGAYTKSKGIYRKKVAFLNKALDTTEIKLCSRRFHEIIPSNVSCYTTIKQPWLLGLDSFKQYFDNNSTMSLHIGRNIINSLDGSASNFYPVSVFVKQAVSLIGNPLDNHNVQLLNKQWIGFSYTILKHGFENMLPIIDVSFSMQQSDSDAFYTAIGFAILIAERSSFGKRIMAVDHQATCINLESCYSFINIIETVFDNLKSNSNTNMNINDAIDVILLSLTLTNSTKRFIEKSTLIIFSDFSQAKSVRFPNIVFWNLAKYNIRGLPCGIHDKLAIYSGIGNGVLKGLPNFLENYRIGKNTMFENVSCILNNSRYDILGNYLRDLQ